MNSKREIDVDIAEVTIHPDDKFTAREKAAAKLSNLLEAWRLRALGEQSDASVHREYGQANGSIISLYSERPYSASITHVTQDGARTSFDYRHDDAGPELIMDGPVGRNDASENLSEYERVSRVLFTCERLEKRATLSEE